jgi:alpha-glucosidase
MRYVVILFIFSFTLTAQNPYIINSPDNHISIRINTTPHISWQVRYDDNVVLANSNIGLLFKGGTYLGLNEKVKSHYTTSEDSKFKTVAYKKAEVQNHFRGLNINFDKGFQLEVRAYNDGAAYRIVLDKKFGNELVNEIAEFNFLADQQVMIPHVSDVRGKEKYTCSFEEFYTSGTISSLKKDTLCYLPFLVKYKSSLKAVVVESDVQNYPGMLIQKGDKANSLKAHFAPYPLEESLGGHAKINFMVTKRADYIAKLNEKANLPWRAMIISSQDKELLNTDMVYKLAEPCKISDPSWIIPGKVAWDWWNDWNLSNVDFEAGINTETYKYYIDFASKNGLEYIILDEGWSDDWDLNILSPKINLAELIAYGKSKKVDLILWSTWYAITRNADALCKKYADMGIKGFKVDFLDRDDQKMMASIYDLASIAAKHKLLLDFHGVFKPQGIYRTWPNVINFEGVRGLEYMKWSADDRTVEHDVTLPYIRMAAGAMDYTPGAMRNATKGNARPNHSLPMGLGTRCHQLAMYVVFEAPLQMLADSPSAYYNEKACTDFIAKIPTTFDETVAIDGQVGEYAIIARRKNKTWYIGAMNNWQGRTITIDLSPIIKSVSHMEVFSDGLNAHKNAQDFKQEVVPIKVPLTPFSITMKPGGGWAAIIEE